MFSVLGKSGLKILRHTSPASTKGPWTMKFIFSQLHLSTVSVLKGLNMCMCVHFSVRDDLHCGLAMSLSCSLPLDVIPTLLAKITLSGLWYHFLYPSPFPAVSFNDHPQPPSLPPFLLSPLISLTDIRTGKRQCNVAVLTATLDWINTCTGFADSAHINYKQLKMYGISHNG